MCCRSVARLGNRLRGSARDERGFTLSEMVVTMAIMGVVIAAVATLFTSGTSASVDLNLRFASQSDARLALDTFRREVHNACDATVSGGTSVTLKTLTSSYACTTNSSTWCTSGSGSRYGLYRKVGASCNATGVLRADYLTGASIFTVTAPAAGTYVLKQVGIDMTVNQKPSISRLGYRIQDSIALRNGARS
jgi:prepilin-type N-terminal cleavage/methylation domain-containing protein